MRNIPLLTLILATASLTFSTHATADWDAAGEAKYQAERKAAREAAAKRQAEDAARRAAVQAQADKQLADNYRRLYGKRTEGLSDAQVLAASRQWDSERASQAKQQALDMIKHLPPEQRAMAEQAMKQAAAQK